MPHEFEWKEEYSVGVKEIDDQHKKLINTIFTLFTSINNQLSDNNLKKVLDELVDYTEVHFTTEENYFHEFNYEEAEQHIKEHNEFKQKVNELLDQYKNNEIKISFELIDFLEDWLVKHLADADQRYIECFKQNNLK